MSARSSPPAEARQSAGEIEAPAQLAPKSAAPWTVRHDVTQFGMPVTWLADADGHVIVRAQVTCAHCGHRGYDVRGWKITDDVQARWLRRSPVRLADLPPDVRVTRPTCASCRRALTQRLVEDPLVAAGAIVAVGVDQTGRCLYVSQDDLAECIDDGRIQLCRDEDGNLAPMLHRYVRLLKAVPET